MTKAFGRQRGTRLTAPGRPCECRGVAVKRNLGQAAEANAAGRARSRRSSRCIIRDEARRRVKIAFTARELRGCRLNPAPARPASLRSLSSHQDARSGVDRDLHARRARARSANRAENSRRSRARHRGRRPSAGEFLEPESACAGRNHARPAARPFEWRPAPHRRDMGVR